MVAAIACAGEWPAMMGDWSRTLSCIGAVGLAWRRWMSRGAAARLLHQDVDPVEHRAAHVEQRHGPVAVAPLEAGRIGADAVLRPARLERELALGHRDQHAAWR